MVLNRVPLGLLGLFVRIDGRMYATPATLRDLGLTWPGAADGADTDDLVELETLPGVHVDYDERGQAIRLDVPVSMLTSPPTPIGYVPPPPPRLDPATRVPGLLFDYSVNLQGDDRHHSVSSWQELRLFGVGPGVWRSSGLLSSSSGDAGSSRAVRLDSSWQLDFPDTMVSVVMGDTFSMGLDWTRSLRFGGIRASRNFDLQPYRVTMPLASFAGETALPSTVDLYINGIRQARQEVMPGRFQIDSAPTLSGLGAAQVVVTDITGQSRVVSFSVYNSRRMLQPGLVDWSLEAGWLRREYGLESFSYDANAMVSGSLRWGASNFLTLETHAETIRGLEMGGAGAQLLLGRVGGAVSASWATSRGEGESGDQHSLGYEWRGYGFSFSASTLRRDPGFRDVASLEGGVPPRRTDSAFVGLSLGRSHLGAGYVRQDLPGLDSARYATLNWSRTLRRYGHISLSLSRDLEGESGTTAFLALSLPLGERRSAWTSLERRDGSTGVTVGAAKSLPGDVDGWGWRAQVSAGDRAGGQAEVSHLSRYGRWRAGVLVRRGDGASSTTGYANASGGLLLMRGGLFPMRHAFDAFALVSTDGIAGVPVMLWNRPVGTTDERGLLLVTSLNAWQNNKLSIDPLVLPADVSVERVRMDAVPSTGSGMLARFPMRTMVAVRLSLRGADGAWIPAGSRVQVLPADGAPGTSTATVGYGGELFLQDPPAGAQLRIDLAGGAQCAVTLPDALPTRGWVQLGELPCR